MEREADAMRRYWDERARENAMWYVDTSCDYQDPDTDAFFATGQRVVHIALTEAPIRPKERKLAVEIGPGLGRISLALASEFDRVIGIDISQEMIERARELVPDPRVEFVLGNGFDLGPIDTASADFVLTFTVLQHLNSPTLIEAYLREAARILKPGGVLAAQWNNTPRRGVWAARVAWWRIRNRIGGRFAMDIRYSPEFAGTRLPMKRVEAVFGESDMVVRGSTGLGSLFAWVWAEKLPG
jgi:ubiquinone/menaquinone biosynthesis C-methylase UbiE